MNHRVVFAFASLLFTTAAFSATYNPSTADTLPTVNISNGIVSIEVNGNGSSNAPYPHYPGITNFNVLGQTLVPFDNAGANLQMSIRSSAGNAYNPTIEGDCNNRPSQLNAMLFQAQGASYVGNWVPYGAANQAKNGVLMGVTPLEFIPPGGCGSPGNTTPYNMNFGISAGDGNAMPPQAIILEMQVQKTSSTAADIVKGLSELPTLYGKLSALQYAFYSTDLQTFQPANAYFPKGCTIGGGSVPCNAPTNNIAAWPISSNDGNGYSYNIQTDPNVAVSVPTPTYYGTNMPPARVVMLCDQAAVSSSGAQPTTGVCIAFYSEQATGIGFSRRQTNEALSSMGMVGDIGTANVISGGLVARTYR